MPEAVQEVGDLAGAAGEDLLALSVGLGLRVMHELMAAGVEGVCGPQGKRDPDRKATSKSAISHAFIERTSTALWGS